MRVGYNTVVQWMTKDQGQNLHMNFGTDFLSIAEREWYNRTLVGPRCQLRLKYLAQFTDDATPRSTIVE